MTPEDGVPLPASTDVLVVGGGIAGASALHHLAEAGIAATLVERGQFGASTTASAVGVLFPPMRQPFRAVAARRGVEKAGEIWRFAARSVEGLGGFLKEKGLSTRAELDLGGGAVMAEPGTLEQVQASYDAMVEAGLPVRWLTTEEAAERSGGPRFPGGYVFDGVGAVAPEAATRALVDGAVQKGATALEGVWIRDVTRTHKGLEATSDRGTITAQMIVYANHLGSRRFSSLVSDELVPIRGQGLSARVDGLPTRPGGFATHWKMNLWRQGPDGTLYLGGWRHDAWDRSYWKTRPDVDVDLQRDLEKWFAVSYPGVRMTVKRRWGGIFAWVSDFLPLIGPLPGSPDELVMVGFSGGGLPFAYEGGRLIANAVAGKDPVEGADVFSPRRFL